LAVNDNLAFLRAVKAGDDVHQSGFAGAAFANDGGAGAGFDGEVDVFEGGKGGVLVAVGFGDVFDLDHW